ncbi:MAG: UDP-glucose/GDP-mannose dehydrogenase family protein [Pseudomonadota bacterium]|nr:UDP-glucose/GDP-mannose dehydrogenase family protein [Pseudomonadota bacterium]
MEVVMVGTGYVGLVSGSCFAEFGANVVCIDSDSAKIEQLREGKIPIFEPGLDELVKKNVEQGKLIFSTSLEEFVPTADLVFIAVGTPTRRGDGMADLGYVFESAKQIAASLQGYTVIVDKSTVPVGTARKVREIVQLENPDADFDVASNPEFLREGAAISDFMRPDRVVIGVESEKAKNKLTELYRPLNLRETPILISNLESAELIKYASNAFLATKISFINEIANLCETLGADVHDIAKGMGMDRRIGPKFLHPGPGYGGSCFPKDTRALLSFAEESGHELGIVRATIEANNNQLAKMSEKIKSALNLSNNNQKIAVLGLTFKPETDDIRESPSLSLLPDLVRAGVTIKAHDPKGLDAAKQVLPSDIIFCEDMLSAIKGSHAIILLTEWNEYRGLDLNVLKRIMQGNVFIDLRNIYERETVESHGFSYFCVGR